MKQTFFIFGGLALFFTGVGYFCCKTTYNIHQDLEKHGTIQILSTSVTKESNGYHTYVYGSDTLAVDSVSKSIHLKRAEEFVKQSKQFDEK